tara:strand:- start:153 stop:605 length:453 start_codon:yes stop_codon:yes gene_type:complete
MTYTINSNSNITIQNSSPTYVILNADTILDGSLVTYTPLNSSSKIIYDYTFHAHSAAASSDIGFAKLQEYNGSAWVDVSNCTKSFGTTNQLAHIVNIKFVIDSWSGSKQLRLYCEVKSSSDNLILYGNKYWQGNSSYYNQCKCVLKVSEI